MSRDPDDVFDLANIIKKRVGDGEEAEEVLDSLIEKGHAEKAVKAAFKEASEDGIGRSLRKFNHKPGRWCTFVVLIGIFLIYFYGSFFDMIGLLGVPIGYYFVLRFSFSAHLLTNTEILHLPWSWMFTRSHHVGGGIRTVGVVSRYMPHIWFILLVITLFHGRYVSGDYIALLVLFGSTFLGMSSVLFFHSKNSIEQGE